MTDVAAQKPIMAIGSVGAGKSTLLAALKLTGGEVKKTEAMTYLDQAIDTPGEMLSIPRFYNAIILNSVRARLVLFLMDASRPSRLPARLALSLKAPVVGVVTKIDVAGADARQRAAEALRHVGVTEIFEISSLSGEGITELNEWISDQYPHS